MVRIVLISRTKGLIRLVVDKDETVILAILRTVWIEDTQVTEPVRLATFWQVMLAGTVTVLSTSPLQIFGTSITSCPPVGMLCLGVTVN